jgi:hypothetical protein
MRQFYEPLNIMLTKGLNPFRSSVVGGSYLTDCANFKPMSGGAQAIKYTRSLSIYDDAQFFITSVYGTIVATASGIYSYNAGVLTPCITGLTGDCNWFIADFGLYMVFTNGTVTVIYSGTTWSVHDGSVIPQANAICNAQGRAVLGGFAAEANKVIWSKIGAMKFLSVSDFDSLNDNTAGYRFMEWEGEIISVLPVGARVAILGSGGVSFLLPASVEPFAYSTFSLHNVAFVGLGNRRGAVVSGSTLFYVNLDNELCVVTVNGRDDPKQTILGFSDYLDAETAKLSYDNRLSELYIAQENETFILNKFGLGKISSGLVSVCFDKVSKETLVHSQDGLTQTYAEIVSDVCDFNAVGHKTVEDLSIIGDNIPTMYGAVEYKLDNTSNFISSPWHEFDSRGYCRIGITSSLFRIKVRLATVNTALLRSLKVGVKYTDKRFTKGVNLGDNKTTSGGN